HVAGDAIVGFMMREFRASGLGYRPHARLFLVATLTAAAIVIEPLGRFGKLVRVVAGDAAESALGLGRAGAGPHLFGVADELEIVGESGRANEHRPKQMQRQTGAEVERFPAAAEDAGLALQMAL